jgi:adenylate cyclase class 2
MNRNQLEMEVKFYLNDLPGFEHRLRSIGASLIQPRTFETNLRFDTPDLSLTKDHRVLRLRHDENNYLTYKGPTQLGKAVSVRQEIEIKIDDFDSTKALLEALGYKESVRYEKWRTKYRLENLTLDLDEMPFGNFVEIEGDDAKRIEQMALSLALTWSLHLNESYMMLFERVKKNRNLEIHNLVFDDFKGIKIKPEDLNVKPADIVTYL